MIVLLATHQKGDDVIIGLVRDMLALFSNGMIFFFDLSLLLVLSYNNFTLHDPKKAKGWQILKLRICFIIIPLVPNGLVG
jgi:hypothetical protein